MAGWGNKGWGTEGYTDTGDEIVNTGQSGPYIKSWFWKNAKRPLTDEELNAHGLHNWDMGRAFSDLGSDLGINPKKVGNNAPGATLDTSRADAERQNTEDLMASLQQQAATGAGGWENTLRAATLHSQNTAQALGQGDTGAGAVSGLMNVGNAKAAAGQRAVGQENMLRKESMMSAQGELGALTGAAGQSDIEQANAAARAKQQQGATNLALIDQAQQNNKNLTSGISQGVSSAFSKGGAVPGSPVVFGDSSSNDTVPAMLSPGEEVIPRSAAGDLSKEIDFLKALHAKNGAQGLADGGNAGDDGISHWTADQYGSGNVAASIAFPAVGQMSGYQNLRNQAAAGAPSIENGGLLDTTNFDKTRANRALLESLLSQRATGEGPSAAAQMDTNSNDAAITQAMAAQRRGVAPGVAVAGGAEEAQQGAGVAAATRGKEKAAGQAAAANVATQGRAQELSLAEAQQQAAWANTMQNLGISLANQAALRNMFSGAGQAMTAASGAHNQPASSYSSWDNPDAPGTQNTLDYNENLQPSDSDLGSAPDGGGELGDFPSSDGPQGAAHGGVIGYADGGEVDELDVQDYGHKVKLDQSQHGGKLMTAGDKAARDRADLEAETGDSTAYDRRQAKKNAPKKAAEPSMAQKLADFARSATASMQVPHFAEGGQLEARRDSGPMAVDMLGNAGVAGGAEGRFLRERELAAEQSGAAMEAQRRDPGFVMVRPGPDDFARNPAFNAPPGYNPVLGTGFSMPAMIARQEADSGKEREALGIKPRAAEATATTSQPEPPAAANPSGGVGVRMPQPDTLARGYADNEAQLALEQRGEAEQAAAHAEVAGIEARQTAMQQAELRMKESQDRARVRTDEAMTRWQAAQDEYSRIDANVDPGRFWASRTTGQKILGIIGLALGAAGTGPDGINRAAQQMNQAIDRDLEAQKAEHELKLKKGASRLEGAKTYYAMAREAGMDDLAATQAAKASALENAALQSDRMMAATKAPIAKAMYQQLGAALHGSALDKTEAAKQRTFENQIQLGDLAIKSQAAGAKGTALGEGERKELHDVSAAAKDAVDLIGNIRGTLARTQSKIPGKTAINQNVGEDSALLDTDTAALVVKLKDIDKLGQIGPGDSALLKEAIGDPKAFFTLESTKRAKLDRLESIIRNSVANQRAARGVQ